VLPGWFSERKQAEKILKAFSRFKGLWLENVALLGFVLPIDLLDFAPIHS